MKLKLLSADVTPDMRAFVGDRIYRAVWSAAPTDATERLIAVLKEARRVLMEEDELRWRLKSSGEIREMLEELE